MMKTSKISKHTIDNIKLFLLSNDSNNNKLGIELARSHGWELRDCIYFIVNTYFRTNDISTNGFINNYFCGMSISIQLYHYPPHWFGRHYTYMQFITFINGNKINESIFKTKDWSYDKYDKYLQQLVKYLVKEINKNI